MSNTEYKLFVQIKKSWGLIHCILIWASTSLLKLCFHDKPGLIQLPQWPSFHTHKRKSKRVSWKVWDFHYQTTAMGTPTCFVQMAATNLPIPISHFHTSYRQGVLLMSYPCEYWPVLQPQYPHMNKQLVCENWSYRQYVCVWTKCYSEIRIYELNVTENNIRVHIYWLADIDHLTNKTFK